MVGRAFFEDSAKDHDELARALGVKDVMECRNYMLTLLSFADTWENGVTWVSVTALESVYGIAGMVPKTEYKEHWSGSTPGEYREHYGISLDATGGWVRELRRNWLMREEQALNPRKALCTTDSAPIDNVLSPVRSTLPSSTPGADLAIKFSTLFLHSFSPITPWNGLSRGLFPSLPSKLRAVSNGYLEMST
jgi:hypothetical protein